MQEPPDPRIDHIREASRRLVRELGFMQQTIAGSSLSLSAVHALIEIGAWSQITARDLSAILRLEKSTVSRLLGALIQDGDVIETRDVDDSRIKRLALTAKGQSSLKNIERFARDQVSEALAPLETDAVDAILDGLDIYASALGAPPAKRERPLFEIIQGYHPALLGRIVEMHARYYAQHVGFGRVFEIKIASELAEFLTRIDGRRNGIWSVFARGRLSGSIVIDGEDLGGDRAHLRWFIVDDSLRGLGAGRVLLQRAIEFCDIVGLSEIHLWTFQGLDAARSLYEALGFLLVEEKAGSQWGKEVVEQEFVRRRR